MTVRLDKHRKRQAWMFVFDLPPGPDGKRRQHLRRGFSTETAARTAERAAMTRFAALDLSADGTVAAELERWLDERELDMSVTGLSSYRDYVRAYVNPHIGASKVSGLDKTIVHGLYKKLLKSGSRTGGPLAASTVRTVHRILQKAFNDLGVRIDGVRQPRKEKRLTKGRKGVWTSSQSVAFLNFVRNDRLAAAWTLAVVCGLRRGELAGLRWSKVNLDVRRRSG